MRKVITCASHSRETIFEDEYFDFCIEHGIGMKDTPWTGLKVKSKGLAKEYVVEIRLVDKGYHPFDGEPVVYKYYDVEVAHGIRGRRETLDETREYVTVLEDAVDFAERVLDWIRNNPDYDKLYADETTDYDYN